MQRRRFFASASATLLTACGDGIVQESPLSEEALKHQLMGQFQEQLGDEATPALMLPLIMNFALTWQAPTVAVKDISRIVAYGFGNRPNQAIGSTPVDGSTQTALSDPGPINEKLADTVYEIYKQKQVKVYAQWEIARFLVSKYGMLDVASIEPITNTDGSITYLSTDGVAWDVIAREGGNAAAMGNVAVVGFREHHKHCVHASVMRGMKAFAPKALPCRVNTTRYRARRENVAAICT